MKGFMTMAACALLLSSLMTQQSGATVIVDVDLVLDWQLGGEDQIIGQITDVFADADGNICLLDAQLNELLVYSPDGEHLRTIGRAGEGPGEFRGPSGALASTNGYGVIQSVPIKLVMFDLSGTPSQNIFPILEDGAGPKSLARCSDGLGWGKHFLLSCIFFRQESGEQLVQEEMALFDGTGQKLEVLFSRSNPVDFTLISELEDNYYQHRFANSGSRLYVAPFFEKYEIQVFNQGSDALEVISYNYTPVERTAEEKQRVINSLTQGLPSFEGMHLQVLNHHRAIEQIDIGPDGQIWVLSGEGAWRSPEGVLGTFDVYSPGDLSFTRQVRIHSPDSFLTDHLWIIGNRVIVIKCARDLLLGPHDPQNPCSENADTQVICYRLDGL